MRRHILYALLHKEALRHITNRGGLVLAGLLIAASLLLSILNIGNEAGEQLVGGVKRCVVLVEDDTDPWMVRLKANVPTSLEDKVFFQKLQVKTPDRKMTLPMGTVVIEAFRNVAAPEGYEVCYWYPTQDREAIAPFERWFRRETYLYFREQAVESLRSAGKDTTALPAEVKPTDDELWLQRLAQDDLRKRLQETLGNSQALPPIKMTERPLVGLSLDLRAAIATALVMFGLFFTCVYLMPSLTCEERERGLLLAQMLTPTRIREMLASKLIFYPGFGIVLATILAGIHNPVILTKPVFWCVMFSLAVGTLGIGITIACITRTQRSASLGSLCYMLIVALILLLCRQHSIPFVPFLLIEYHAPHLLHGLLVNPEAQSFVTNWPNLLASGVLAVGWLTLAAQLFRRRGWQ